MATYIEFVQRTKPENKKTSVWEIYDKENESYLGLVKFYEAWREYCFFAAPCTIFEWICLREIADFCEERTREWRENKKGELNDNTGKVNS